MFCYKPLLFIFVFVLCQLLSIYINIYFYYVHFFIILFTNKIIKRSSLYKHALQLLTLAFVGPCSKQATLSKQHPIRQGVEGLRFHGDSPNHVLQDAFWNLRATSHNDLNKLTLWYQAPGVHLLQDCWYFALVLAQLHLHLACNRLCLLLHRIVPNNILQNRLHNLPFIFILLIAVNVVVHHVFHHVTRQ